MGRSRRWRQFGFARARRLQDHGACKRRYDLVRNKVLSARAAAKQSKMPIADFKKQYKRFLEADPEKK